ncbi:sterol carrier protein 2-like [Phlebotomus papatasi]|uniref:SCP2 domain-containing protein n=1 Tax=Phlebotomus papatasi TaxID=29031 RepID=A0A1B0DKP5_PHLPP|nr:sterol carrier protein 2-like [Phlebotomus papatasi]
MSFKSDAIIEKIKVRLTKIDPNNRQVEHVYKFNITVGGKVAKTWVLDLKNVKVFEGDSPDVECSVTVSDEDFFAMGSGTLSTKDALAQDKIDVDGNLELVGKLAPFVSSL